MASPPLRVSAQRNAWGTESFQNGFCIFPGKLGWLCRGCFFVSHRAFLWLTWNLLYRPSWLQTQSNQSSCLVPHTPEPKSWDNRPISLHPTVCFILLYSKSKSILIKFSISCLILYLLLPLSKRENRVNSQHQFRIPWSTLHSVLGQLPKMRKLQKLKDQYLSRNRLKFLTHLTYFTFSSKHQGIQSFTVFTSFTFKGDL